MGPVWLKGGKRNIDTSSFFSNQDIEFVISGEATANFLNGKMQVVFLSA